MSMGFGVPITPQTLRQVNGKATPAAGDGSEVIWHVQFDSQTYTSAVDTLLQFFTAGSTDQTLSNNSQAGQLPANQSLQIHQITCDILSALPVTFNTEAAAFTSASGVGNDLALLLMGSAQRPTWTLYLNNKAYGPYPLTFLHGSGGPDVVVAASDIGTSAGSIQFARNTVTQGWNYWGNIIINSSANFSVSLNWKTAATMTANKIIRLGLCGILNRKIQ